MNKVIMSRNNNDNSMHFFKCFVVLCILVSMHFWSFVYFQPFSYYHIIITAASLGSCLILSTSNKKTDFIDTIVIWTIITIYLSIISSIYDYRQSFYPTVKACTSLAYPLFVYFVIKKAKIPQSFLIKVITIICLIWVFLELFQQFIYPPQAYFSGRLHFQEGQGKMLEERMGLWRFYIWGVDFVMLAFSYWLSKTKEIGNKFKSILLTIIFSIGIICYVSRKHIYVIFTIFFLYAIKGTKKKRYYTICLVAILFILFYYLFFQSFVELNDQTVEEIDKGEDFIRFMSAEYYLFDFSNSTLYPFFGAGMDVEGSSLYRKLQYAQSFFGTNYGFWQSDVGIIGYYSKFGLFGVSAILLYIGYFLKNWKYVDDWLKYFFLMKLFLIVFDFWAIWDVGMMAYVLFLYFLNCNIKKNKLNEKRYAIY